MKNLYLIYIQIFVLALTICSCEDAFTTTLEIEPPEHIDRLVVQAYGSTNGMDLNVFLTKSVGLLEDIGSNESVSGAEVTLWKGDELLAQLDQASSSSNFSYNYFLPEGSITYEKGATYRLEVVADGFEKAIGTATVPNDIPLLRQKFEEDGASLDPGDSNSEVEIEFQDPPNQENFYEVNVSRINTNGSNTFYEEEFTETYDPSGQQGLAYSNLIINDLSFDGELKKFPLVIRKFNTQAVDDMYVLWRVTSEAHYLFNKTSREQVNQDDNPFASPVQIFSNIENGIGIFSIVNEEFYKVDQ